MKVSLEELIIALRDDIHLLNDADHLFATVDAVKEGLGERVEEDVLSTTLYPKGFSFAAFVDVVESERVWE